MIVVNLEITASTAAVSAVVETAQAIADTVAELQQCSMPSLDRVLWPCCVVDVGIARPHHVLGHARCLVSRS